MRKPLRLFWLSLFAVIFAVSSQTRATRLFSEPFDYPADTPLHGQGGWFVAFGGPSGGEGNLVKSPSVDYPMYGSSGNRHTFPGNINSILAKDLDATTTAATAATDGSTVYLAMAFGEVGRVQWHDGTLTRIDVSSQFTTNNRVELKNATDTAEQNFFYTNFANPPVRLFVLRLILNAGPDSVRIAWNPDLSLGEPNWNTLPGTNTIDINEGNAGGFRRIRLHDPRQADDTVTAVDEIRVATTWADLFGIPGDFNNDSVVNAADIDLLCTELTDGGADDLTYDVNGDNLITFADVTFEVEDIIGTNMGDSDTDGDVDLTDLGNLATNYGATSGATWGQGDFDCDHDVDLTDLGTLATNYGLGEVQAFADFQALTSVPEPGSLISIGLAGMAMTLVQRKLRINHAKPQPVS